MHSAYYITAELRVKSDKTVAETLPALKKLCELSLQEQGCSLFSLHQCAEDERRFLLWECFDDEAAFKQHFEEPHTLHYLDLGLTDIVQYFQSALITGPMASVDPETVI